MKPTPKVSLCIPAYRQVDYLRGVLDSVRMQDFPDFELVLTDDSPDSAVETLFRAYPADDRWHYQRNPRQLGTPANWNEAVRRSEGEFIKLLHHDDAFVDSTSLSKFVRLLEASPEADFGLAASEVRDMASGTRRFNRPTPRQLNRISEAPARLFSGNLLGAPSATIYRRSLLLEYDPAFKWLVDVEFYIRALTKNPRIAFSAEPLIVTPTNAVHQVTELVRDDPAVDISEHLAIFSKLRAVDRNRPEMARAWRRLVFRYGIRSADELTGRFHVAPALVPYFETLFEMRGSLWASAMRGAYRASRTMPRPLQALARRLFHSVRR